MAPDCSHEVEEEEMGWGENALVRRLRSNTHTQI